MRKRSVEERRDRPQYVMFEGPPTANAGPGIHHVLSRVFKDIMPRYKTMKGFCAPRKAGWDTHGLPVELEVEKSLGITRKAQIEEHGIAEFNAACKQNVMRYVKEWEALTDRIGFWIDMEHPYVTFENSYIESMWWILKQLWDRGLIYEAYRSIWHCPRCVTSLSDHEVAQGYNDKTKDVAIFVKFRVDLEDDDYSNAARSLIGGSPLPTSILAWTTTPWTLPGNTALAVDPDADYAVVQDKAEGAIPERLIMAEALIGKLLPKGYETLGTVKGSDLAGIGYKALYNPVAYRVPGIGKFAEGRVQRGASYTPGQTATFHVVGGDFVSLDEGTGVVHIAPAFGEDDFKIGASAGLYFRPARRFAGRDARGLPLCREVRKGRRRGYHRRPDGPGTDVPEHPDSPHLPLLLAVQLAADLLRQELLVHQHHGHQRHAAGQQRQGELVPRPHQVGPVRGVAEERA